LAHGCANRNRGRKALILKKNENDAFRFSCVLKTQEGFLDAPSRVNCVMTTQSEQSLRARLPSALAKSLDTLGYHALTPIQRAALPVMLDGLDVRTQAKTGSGKTAAFGLAMLACLKLERIELQGLVLCPTRELAEQVAAELRRLGANLANLKILTIVGGMAMGPQQASLIKHAPHIIVGTPGRILDHLTKQHLSFDRLSTLVLDEADRLLDMGFADTLNALIDAMPERRQTWLLSATFPESLDQLSARVQRNAQRVEAAFLLSQ
jgi:ATP-dependent RNA helicase DbpA